jgi:hypothetical protein
MESPVYHLFITYMESPRAWMDTSSNSNVLNIIYLLDQLLFLSRVPHLSTSPRSRHGTCYVTMDIARVVGYSSIQLWNCKLHELNCAEGQIHCN